MNLINGDCIEAMKGLADNSVDAVVTDPPYFLLTKGAESGFMNKDWDGVSDLWGHLW